jgi:hypothetical protein
MAAFVFFDAFKQRLGDGEIDLTTSTGHAFKLRLTNTTPNVDTHDDAADLTAITGGSYADAAITHTWAETSAGSGVWRFAASADPTWTAVSTDFTTARYVALFDDTHANDALVGYWDYGVGGFTLTAGNTFTLNLDANFEIFTLDG